MLKVKNCLKGKLSQKQNLKGKLSIGKEYIYPELIDLEINPNKETQTFNHPNNYGYNNVVVNPISDEYIIPTGIKEITENTIYDVREYASVSASVHPAINLQEKTITPTKETQIVEADTGYDGLSKVNVNAISDEYIVPSGEIDITENGTYDVTNYASANVNVSGGGGSTPDVGFVINECNSNGYATKVTVVGITSLPSYAFNSYQASYNNLLNKYLTTVILPDDMITIGQYAFRQCTNLNLNTLPSQLYNIGQYAFYFCNNSNLTVIDFSQPLVTKYIYDYAFSHNKLKTISLINNNTRFPVYLGNYAFQYNGELTEVLFDGNILFNGKTFIFRGCTSLEKFTIKPHQSTTIPANTFNGDTALTALIIDSENIIINLGNTSAFTNTPIASGTGYIYVADSLVDTYKTSTNWSTYADQIKPISELLTEEVS